MASVGKHPWKTKAGGHVLTVSWCLLATAFLKPPFKPPHPNHQRCLWESVLLVDEKDGGLCQVEMRHVLDGVRQEVMRSLWKHLNDLRPVALVGTCVWFEKGASTPSSFGTCDLYNLWPLLKRGINAMQICLDRWNMANDQLRQLPQHPS